MSEQHEEKDLNITESISKVEHYIETNKKIISIVLGAILLLVGGYFGYKKLIVAPQEKEAEGQMFIAERYFEMDSLNLAINGDGNYLGFEAIINQYGITPSANLAHYYLGMCYLRKGDYEKAIENLKNYSGNDEITVPLATGAIGDAYMELNKVDDAVSYYKKAAELRKNKFTAPIFLMKAGLAYEELGKYQDAVDAYEKIKKDYAETNEGREADKYIARAKALTK